MNNLHEMFECTHLKFKVSGHPHAQCSQPMWSSLRLTSVMNNFHVTKHYYRMQ